MESVYSNELLEQFRSGKKEFSNIILQFADLNDTDLTGLVIKNSKINYASFRLSNMKNVKFIDCEMFFVSFYSAEMENTLFEKCKMDMTRFDDAHFKNTRIMNSSLSYCLIVGVNMGELNLTSTAKFKVITDMSAVVEDDIAGALKIIGARIEELPIEIRYQINKRIAGTLQDFSKDTKLDTSAGNRAYGSNNSQYNRVFNAYQAINALGDELIKYGKSEIYKNRKPYEK